MDIKNKKSEISDFFSYNLSMNEKELIKKCLIDKDAIETYPFADSKYKGTPILRHKSNNKWFGVVFEQEGILYINLKARPEEICILKDQFPESILPAWHMNKRHWYKADVNSISTELLDRLIKRSFEITQSKKKK